MALISIYCHLSFMQAVAEDIAQAHLPQPHYKESK